MKTVRNILFVSALMTFVGAHAQSSYEAARVMGSDLNGTARFVGMGGAMGALGGDISTIGTNPAGIGIYRSNDIAVSFGFNNTSAESNFGSSVMKDNRTRMSFDNIGFVYSNKIGNNTSLRYVNFGFNYHKKKNFNRVFAMGGALGGPSMSGQMAEMTLNLPIEDFNALLDDNETDFYRNPEWNDVAWLTIMGAKGNLLYDDGIENGNQYYAGLIGQSNNYTSKESGSINQYDFNIAFNFEDRFYLGATLGVYDVNYKRESLYSETVNTGDFTLSNWFHTEGTGIDLKLGAIIRPFESSPFRIGAAVHTPVWYSLTDMNSAYLESYINYEGVEYHSQQSTPEAVTNYDVTTPWKFNLSLGTTVGGMVAVGAEYEYEDYSTAKMKDSYGNVLPSEADVKSNLKGVHTLRLGIETRVEEFSIRAGYNYSTAAFDKGAFKYLPDYSVYTATEYENAFAKNAFTFGVGYRGSVLYADLAYKYDTYKSDFYAFDNMELKATKVDNNRHQLLFTLGARF